MTKFKKNKTNNLNVSKDCPTALPDENLTMFQMMKKSMAKNTVDSRGTRKIDGKEMHTND